MIAMQKRRLDKFCVDEVAWFNDGWHVDMCEQSLECDFAGAKLMGKIDRVDRRGDELFVLDYKTGLYKLYNKNNFSDATDFQLEFYYLLASKLGSVKGCGFYDLKDVKIVNEPFMQEKLGVLESNIKDMLNIEEINFTKCEDIKNCVYCDYSTICQRES
jgi:CRISPR/Cas system-associated exonuclease Cas4 (RecB family)